jgi:hypothetical protein
MSRRIVAFLDVLGFKSLAETLDQEALVEIYRDLQRAARLQTTRPVFPEDHRRFDADAYYEDHEIRRERVASVVMASDSIIIYSEGTEWEDALAVGAAVRNLLIAGFRNGIPLRGGIAIGALDEVRLPDNTIQTDKYTADLFGLVGLGLIRAYELEQRCSWSGAILHPELIEHLRAIALAEHDDGTFTGLDALAAPRLVIQTDVPLKDAPKGELESTDSRYWVIDWPFVAKLSLDWSISAEAVAAAFTSYERSLGEAEEVKRRETLAFMERADDDADATRRRLFEPRSE